MGKTRYAVAGVGGWRVRVFAWPSVKEFADRADPVALVDSGAKQP